MRHSVTCVPCTGLALLLLGACGSGDQAPGPRASDPPATAAPSGAPVPAAAPAALPRDRERDVHGLTVKVNADDTIVVRGLDQWGGRVDTTYENATFLRDALPALGRSLTEEQVRGLRAIADEIQGGSR